MEKYWTFISTSDHKLTWLYMNYIPKLKNWNYKASSKISLHLRGRQWIQVTECCKYKEKNDNLSVII